VEVALGLVPNVLDDLTAPSVRKVSILVFVEVALGLCQEFQVRISPDAVSILVFVEVALGLPPNSLSPS